MTETEHRVIKVLPPELQNQIAAGEVVERPASVLKELIENSLDAGADSIEVNIEGGGRGLISVQDNGHGLSAQDMELALTRHATSKLDSADDLQALRSFGFRGEALPSIASVSRMEFFSCLEQEPEGAHLQTAFGRILEKKPAPLRRGSRVEVRDLFANTPARLKFLKTQQTEYTKCQEVVQRFALAQLQVGLRFVSGGRLVLQFPRGESLGERVRRIWPESISNGLLEVDSRGKDGTRVHGLVGSPESAQARAGRILLYVNQRPVQDKLLLSALRQAYKGRLLSREYPQAVLFLEVPSRAVDVNVHPAKSEVRFRDEQGIFSLIRSGVLASLEGYAEDRGHFRDEPASNDWGPEGGLRKHRQYCLSSLSEESSAVAEVPEQYHGLQPAAVQGAAGSDPPEGFSQASNLRSSMAVETGSGEVYLGQIFKTYLLIKDRRHGLRILDQHAAHERVLFEKFKRTGEDSPRQELVLPFEKKLHRSEQSALEKCAPLLRRLGFSFERPSREQVLLRSVPSSLDVQKAGDFFKAVLSEQLETLDQIWCLLACRQAVKAGEELAPDEAVQLIVAWSACREPHHCPHGRPTAVSLELAQLERMFKRS